MARKRLVVRRVVDVGSADRGASVVEFAMIVGLLVFVLFAVLQVAVYAYASNVVAASAADGARFAASAGADLAAGGERASTLIRAGLSASAARQVSCRGERSVDAPSGLATVTVRCVGRLRPIVVPLGVRLTIDVSSSVLQEQRP
jgi:Flp pilus assembly protein TadG